MVNMYIKIIIIAAVVIIGIFGILSLLAGSICPPPGWQGPRPPWCEVPETGGEFQYRELDYITESYPETDKILITGIGTMDMWGNPHLLVDLGEDPGNNYESTMERIGTIGSEALYLTDFRKINDDFTISEVPKSTIPSAITLSQEEMNNVVNAAKKNRQNTVILITNLYDPGFTYTKWLGQDISQTPYSRFSSADPETRMEYFNIMWPEWKEAILLEAEKAETAGVDYLIINPGDTSFLYYIDLGELSSRYEELIPDVREKFSGKTGFGGLLPYVANDEFKVLDDVDFVVVFWDTNGDYKAREIFADTTQDAEDIEASFVEWLSLPEWANLAGKETYISVTLPSYDGALQEGWIEPVQSEDRWTRDDAEQALGYEGLFRALYNGDYNISGVFSYGYWWSDQVYPVSKDLRNDIMHSIRQKDAESVFYKWSGIFG